MVREEVRASEDVIRAVTCVIQTCPGLSTDDLILACRPYTWNHVFLALDELIRTGVVRFRPGEGYFTLLPATTTTPHIEGKRARRGVKAQARAQV
jgi:hypothetical protein